MLVGVSRDPGWLTALPYATEGISWVEMLAARGWLFRSNSGKSRAGGVDWALLRGCLSAFLGLPTWAPFVMGHVSPTSGGMAAHPLALDGNSRVGTLIVRG